MGWRSDLCFPETYITHAHTDTQTHTDTEIHTYNNPVEQVYEQSSSSILETHNPKSHDHLQFYFKKGPTNNEL